MDLLRETELAVSIARQTENVLNKPGLGSRLLQILAGNTDLMIRYETLIHYPPEERTDPGMALYYGGLRSALESSGITDPDDKNKVINTLAGIEIAHKKP